MRFASSVLPAAIYVAGATSATAAGSRRLGRSLNVFDGDKQGKGKGKNSRKSYVLTFKKKGDEASKCASLAEEMGGVVEHVYSTVLSGCSLGLPSDRVSALKENPSIGMIEENEPVSLAAKAPSWGLDRINQVSDNLDDDWDKVDGSGVTMYIVDTGIQSDHPDFDGLIDANSGCHRDETDEGNALNDGNGHGTHVASTACGNTYGVAQNCDLCAIKVLNRFGNGNAADTIAGVDFAAGNCNGDCVMNLSLGGGVFAPLNQAVANAVNMGIVMVVAAGNDDDDACNYSPASEPLAITVAAIRKEGASCMSGETRVGVPSKAQFKSVRDLDVGDEIEGLDENMDPATCSVEAVGYFGTGLVFGNYTEDHFILDASNEVVHTNGNIGERDVVDKYAVLTSCPVGLDESGVGFTPLASVFLDDQALTWSEYVLIHRSIVSLVQEVGPFVFSPSTYTSMDEVKKYTGKFRKTMLNCAKDPGMCDDFEMAAVDFVDNALTKDARKKVMSGFGNLGNSMMSGSVAAAVSKGKSVRMSPRNKNEDAGIGSPASAPVRVADRLYSDTNFGACVDVYAPGVKIVAAKNTGGTKKLTGTSMASPHVAGIAAGHLNNGVAAGNVVAEILDAVVDVGLDSRTPGAGIATIIGLPTALTPNPTPKPTSKPSCMSGETRVGVPSKARFKSVRDLDIGDTIEGLDADMDPVICSVEAVGYFGTGPVFGNYTRDHFILDISKEVVHPNGDNGESDVVDKYAVLTSCPVGLDESGVGFTAVDSDFLGNQALEWSDYVLIHEALVNLVRESGPIVFSPSAYTSMEKVKSYTGRFSKTMLKCAKNADLCDDFEMAAVDLVENTLTKKAKKEVKSGFVNLGNAKMSGSVAAAVSKGKSVRK